MQYLHGVLQLLQVVFQRGVHQGQGGLLQISSQLLVQSLDQLMPVLDLVRLVELLALLVGDGGQNLGDAFFVTGTEG